MSDSDLDLRVAWQRHVGEGRDARRSYESVISRYREPQRHYHDVRHVRWVVRHVTSLGAGAGLDDADLGEAVAAAFFHDAIYDPRSSGNEAASAELAREVLTGLAWTPARIETVAAMIDGTATHDHAGVSLATSVMYAADLGVLAADASAYGDYVRNVRREYAHVTDADWVTGRAGVLEEFTRRTAIYDPALGLVEWETRARANIAAELATLAG